MSNEVEFRSNSADLEAKLDRLIQKARELQSLVQGGGSASSGGGVNAGIGQHASAAQVQSTVAPAGGGGVTDAQRAAASFLQGSVKGFNAATVSPQIAGQLQAMGVIPAGPTAAGTAQSAANVAATASSPSAITQQIGTMTMQMPAWAAPYAPSAGRMNPAIGMPPGGGNFPPGGGVGGGYGGIGAGAGGYNWNPLQRGFVIGAAAYGASGLLSGWANTIATGEYDPMSNARRIAGETAGLVTGIAAAAASPGAPGVGFVTGYGLGRELGGAAGELAIAPFMRSRNMAQALFSVSSRMGIDPYDIVNADRGGTNGIRNWRNRSGGPGLASMAQQISEEGKSPSEVALLRSGIYTGTDIIGGPQLARTYATLGSALMAAGDDPMLALNPSLAAARKFGISAEASASMAAPVIAARNRMGRNPADLFLQFGPEAYGMASDLTDLPNMDDSREVLKTYQRTGYRARRASLGVRNTGSAVERELRSQMMALSMLPGGQDSMAYAEAAAGARGAAYDQFNETMTGSFGLEQVRLNANLARAQFRPYAPGEVIGNRAALIRSQFGEAGAINSFIGRRRASGELSTQEEYELTSRAAALQTEAYGSLSSMAMGSQNLLPGIQASGRFGAGLRRFTGAQQASVYFANYAPFRRDQGFAGGGHAAQADAFLNGLGIPAQPVSRSAEVNNPMATGEMTNILRQILTELQRANSSGNGSFQRPQRGPGDIQRGGSGGGAPFN